MAQSASAGGKRSSPAIAGLLVLCLVYSLLGSCAPGQGTPKPTGAAPQPTLTGAVALGPTGTAAPADTSQPPEAETSTPGPGQTVSAAGLPGLQPAGVSRFLAQRELACGEVEKMEPFYTWSCSRVVGYETEFRVDCLSWSPDSVDFLNATILQFLGPDDEAAASFLGFIATIPYAGAQPEQARAWVESTLPGIQGTGDIRTATFGGVQFQLFGKPGARILQLGRPPG